VSRYRSGHLARLLFLMAAMLPFSARAASQTGSSSDTPARAAIPLDEAVMGGGLVMQAHAQVLRPAPLPDLDITAPGPSGDALAAQNDPRIGPDFFNSHARFAGDGYAAGSSIENDHNNRHSPAGGMSLSIPMP